MRAVHTFDARVRAELVAAMRRQAPLSALSAASMALFIAWLAWERSPHGIVFAWLAVLLLIKMTQLAVDSGAFGHAGSRPPDARSWERFYFATIVATGCVWSVAPFLFLTADSPQSNGFIMVALCALGIGGVPALMYHPPSMVVFLVLALAPLGARLYLLDLPALAALAIGTLAFMLGFGWMQGRVTRESIRLRYENAALVASLTQQKDATQAALALAEEANRAKSRFFAAASHDLRQPLHALALFSAALHENDATPARQALVGQVNASVDALGALFDEVLDLARIDAGSVEPKLAHLSVSRLFDAMQKQFAPIATSAALDLRIVPCGAVMVTDATLISRIVANLLANAIRYTPEGSVLLGCRRRGDKLSIEVWDTGIGIAAQDRERIFEEFVQLGNAEHDRRQGMGLGLPTVRRLAALLGHRLELKSVPGRGTVFRVDVPRGESSRVALERPVLERIDLLAGKRVVVIDDERAIRDGMHELLSRWGCLCVSAAEPEQAIARLDAAGAPHLIICDLHLTGAASGITVIGDLRRRYGTSIPALLVTADTSPAHLHDARDAGCLLQHKPLRPVQLRAACNHLLAMTV
jgi:two-component system, sensor histidine kinase